MNNIFQLELPIKPPSLNSAHRVFKGRLILAESSRDFYKDMQKLITRDYLEFIKKDWDNFHVEVNFNSPKFYTKKGILSKTGGDVDNMWKLLGDCLFNKCGVDDSKIIKLVLIKNYSINESTNILIHGFKYEK